MTANVMLVCVVAAAFCAAAMLNRHVQRDAQVLRLELARRGETLLASGRLSAGERSYVAHLLDNAFGYGATWPLLFLAAPLFAVALLFSRSLRRSLGVWRVDCDVSRELRDLSAIYASVMAANHPLVYPLLGMWLETLLTPVLWIARLFDHGGPSDFEPAAVAARIAHRTRVSV